MDNYDFVVLGSGLAGLSFAKRISENGNSVLLLEKENIVGGLSRSLHHKGFFLDFCAHRFHTNNIPLLKEVLALPEFKMYKHNKKSRIYMFGKYLKYPFELQNLLRAMPISESFTSGISFLWNMIIRKFKKKQVKSYKDWFIYFYGKKLYEIMCYPYTSKIWCIDPAKISADWANERFQGEQMTRLIKRIIKKLLTLDFSSYSLEDESLAPDGGSFYYPESNIQELPDAFLRAAKNKGAKSETNTVIKSVSKKRKEVVYIVNSKTRTIGYDKLISSIPLHDFYNILDKKDKKIKSTLNKLKYMDIIFIYLFLNKDNLSNDHWLYFPDEDIIFNRAVEFSNWSPKMCPKNKTSVCFDITAYKGDKIWQMDDKELAEKVIFDAERINYLDKKDIFSYLVFRVENAYPFYDLDYKKKLRSIVASLEDQDVFLLGRTGIFRYNNADNSIEMGFELADNFINNKPAKSIFEYEIKSISF